MKRNDLFNLIGQTDWFHYTTKKSKFPSLYRYGKVEFYFEEDENGRLIGIQTSPLYQEADLNGLKVNYGVFESEISYEDCILFFQDISIKYETVQSKYDTDDVRRLNTEGKVHVIFSEDEDNITLYKISKFVELENNKPRMKQISFSISVENYELLKKIALEEKRSISNSCKEIIENALKKK